VKTPHLAADVLLAADDLYVLDHEGTVTAYDTRKGERRWSREDVLGESDVTTGALRWADGELVVRGQKRVAVLDAKGEEVATFAMPPGARGRGDAWRGRMVVANDTGDLVLSSGGEAHTIETESVRGFDVLEHDVVVVDADGIETIDPADVELEGAAPPDADPLWDLRDDAQTNVAGRPSALPMTARLDPDGARTLYVDATQVSPGDHVRIELGWTEDGGTGCVRVRRRVDGRRSTRGEMSLAWCSAGRRTPYRLGSAMRAASVPKRTRRSSIVSSTARNRRFGTRARCSSTTAGATSGSRVPSTWSRSGTRSRGVRRACSTSARRTRASACGAPPTRRPGWASC
jgi:hypothetical protein